MTCYRSTTVALATNHCPRAIDYLEQGVHYDREHFAPGIAAHAVLDALHKLRGGVPEAQAVALRLVTEPRTFDGRAEPPMSADHAAQGVELALRWWNREQTEPHWFSEQGLAVDADWNPCAYDSTKAYWKAACDIVGAVQAEGDGFAETGLLVRDWKSAWTADASELGKIQTKGQALVAIAHAAALGVRDPSFVRREIANLRTGQVHAEDTRLDDDFWPLEAAKWRREIALAVAASEVRGPDGKRVARPGAGCMGCPYLMRCQPAQDAGQGEDLAAAWVVATAIRDETGKALRLAAREAPIPIPGGFLGYQGKRRLEVSSEAFRSVALRWFKPANPESWEQENGQILGLIKSLAPTKTNLEAVAKVLFQTDRTAREAWVNDQTIPTTVAEFGPWMESP